MCGIVGFLGAQKAAPVLLSGLKHLEYRGYDSAGICINDDGLLKVIKTKGRISVLEELVNKEELQGNIGIGHTRWATHGKPNDINSHPHLSNDKMVAVVHNGIIENYQDIKKDLLEKGIKFQSETDTEVIAQLLGLYLRNGLDNREAIFQLLKVIKGSYALAILFANQNDKIYAIRKNAPLLLGYGIDGNYLASDATALIEYTRDIVYLDDNEIAILTKDSIEILDENHQQIEKKHHHIDWQIDAVQKGGFNHFMLKEIFEEPIALGNAISPRIKDGRIDFGLDIPIDFNKIVILACGSSNHVGQIASYNLERLTRIPVNATMVASEFRYCDPIVDEKTLCIVISQSGETLDTLMSLREAKRKKAKVISIVNVYASTIARESDYVIYTYAGPEIAVATTKAFNTQLILLDMLGIYLADKLKTITKDYYQKLVEELELLPIKIKEVLETNDHIENLAKKYQNQFAVFFIGRNIDYALSLEGSLKLKEVSYIHSEAYASGELKHGTISLIENGTLVIAPTTYKPLFEKAQSNIVEVKARGAKVLALTTTSLKEELNKIADDLMIVPETIDIFLPNLSVVALQLFAYYMALEKGCDIDKPRNLAKSVTVE